MEDTGERVGSWPVPSVPSSLAMPGDTQETSDGRIAASSAHLATMRILQVLPRYAPAWAYGGGVRMFWLLAHEFARRGHQIEVVTSDSLSPHERAEHIHDELEPRIHVRRFRNRFNSMSASLPAVFYRPRSMRLGLREAMARSDVAHMGESRGIHNLWTAQAAAEARVPLAWSAFGGLPTASGVRGLYRRAHDVFLTRQVVPHVDAFIAQTPHEGEVYREHGAPAGKIHEIPLCVDLSSFENLPERGELRRRLGVDGDERLVASVARLAPVKGLDFLVEAFARIPRSGRGPHLALVGWDHGSLQSLQALVQRLGLAGRVHFPGALYGDERMIAYRDADVFCLTPIVFEETSLAALEAAASGCPTVLTSECEIPGLANAGGGLVVPRDRDRVAEALASLLSDDSRRRHMGNLAREHLERNFSVTSVVDRHEALFRTLTR
jgi:glycosyltransferase involved in cell wall biosynthesis